VTGQEGDPQGAAGNAWSHEIAVVGVKNLSAQPDATSELAKVGLDAIELIPGEEPGERIETVLALPIKDSAQRVIGVVNFDDEHGWRDSPMCRQEFLAAATELSHNVAGLLLDEAE
jgi:hypothetical protein